MTGLGRVRVLGLLLAGACQRGDAGVAEPPSSTTDGIAAALPAANTTTARLMRAVGAGAPVVLAMRDAGWPDVQARVLDGLGPMAKELGVDKASDAVAAISLLGRAIGVETLPSQLEGRDGSLPVVFAGYEAPFSGAPGTTIARLATADARQFPLRHQLVVPAADRDVLLASIRAWLTPLGEPAPALVSGHDGAVGVQVAGSWPELRFVAAIPEQSHVRIVVLDHVRAMTAADVSPWLDAAASTWTDTPASRLATDETFTAAMHLRPWNLRATWAWMGMSELHQALDSISADQVATGRARGTSIAGTVELLTPDDHAEFDDWAVAIRGDDKDLRLAAVASLTPLGRTIWSAGAKASVTPLAVKGNPAATLVAAVDLLAMIGRAEPHDLHDVSLGKLAEWSRDCGIGCPAFAALRWPMSLAATWSASEVTEALKGVRGAQLVFAEGNLGKLLGWAAAVHTTGSESGFGALAQQARLSVETAKAGDNEVVLIAPGSADPRTVFDPSGAEAASDALVSASLTTTTNGTEVSMRAGLHLAGTALAAELVVGPGALEFKPDYSAAQWPSPMRSAPASKGAACLLEATKVAREGLVAVVTVAFDRRPKMLAETAANLAEPIRCAAAEPSVAVAANALADSVAIMLADSLVDQNAYRQAASILEQRCRAGADKASRVCKRQKALAEIRMPQMVKRTMKRCSADSWDTGVATLVGKTKTVIGGTSVSTDASAIAAALVHRLGMEDRHRKEPERIALMVADTTPFSDVRPVLDAAAALGAEVVPMVDTGSGHKPLAVLELNWPSKTSVDWKVAKGFVPSPSFVEEEPPLSVRATPLEGEEGRMGHPSSGPSRSVTVAITLKPGSMTGLLPDGRSLTLRQPSEIEMLVEEAGGRGLFRRPVKTTLSVSPDVPWSEVVDVLLSACPRSLQLVR